MDEYNEFDNGFNCVILNFVILDNERSTMGRTSKTITLSLPLEMATKVEELVREEGRTKSELLREALTRYIEEREWERIYKYGERKAKELGIREKDVDRIIHEYRAEKKKAQSSTG